MLGYLDGTDHHDGASYLELAEFLMRTGDNTPLDLEELWRRIVFNIAISNTDDHLRNHGFLLASQGWRLSPAYDLNPSLGQGLSLNISEDDNSLEFELALEVAGIFRLSQSRAVEILKEVSNAVSKWRKVADNLGISRSEQEMMAEAFRTS
jgi:serine/threonine-protein kinase HipA